MEDFEYKGVKLRHREMHSDRCAGCYFWDREESCIPSEVPECNTGIFIKVD